MEKFCVFCGEKPVDKNKEHIIPKWLISKTGDLNRKINLGINWRTKEKLSYSFNSFVFPACYECNKRFGLLEEKVKPVILKIENNDDINQQDITTLLDWLDKVRVGLWLAYITLNSDYLDINPHQFISTRVAIADRMVAIYKVDDMEKGICFRGVNTPAFHYQPSCFGLTINNYCFLNISTHSLISRRIGFPYLTNARYSNDPSTEGMVVADLQKGKERVMFPLIKKPLSGSRNEFYQPIIDKSVIDSEYVTDYVKKNILDINNGIGRVFVQGNASSDSYFMDETTNISLHNLKEYSRFELDYLLTKQIFEHQILLNESQMVSSKFLSKEEQEIIKIKTEFATNFNKTVIGKMRMERIS